MVYRGLVQSILSFNVVTWCRNITIKNKARLARIANTASKLIGRDQRQLSSLYRVALKRRDTQTIGDSDHPFRCFPQRDVLKDPGQNE